MKLGDTMILFSSQKHVHILKNMTFCGQISYKRFPEKWQKFTRRSWFLQSGVKLRNWNWQIFRKYRSKIKIPQLFLCETNPDLILFLLVCFIISNVKNSEDHQNSRRSRRSTVLSNCCDTRKNLSVKATNFYFFPP